MALLKTNNVRLAGLAAAVPQQKASNLELELLSERERQQLVRTTGITWRRIARPEQCASDLCQAAAEELLNALDWHPETIDLLVFVSQSPDQTVPGTASQLQDRLGLGKQTMAIDLNQGCAGYVYGLSVANSLMQGGIRRGLLLVGDTITHTLSSQDKSTVPIFSDAGSATALEFAPDAAPMHFNLQTDGSGYQAICIEAGGARMPFGAESFAMQEFGPGIQRGRGHLSMQGLDVFNFALAEVAPNIKALLEFAGLDLDWADAYVLHQANLLLNESIRRKLGIPAEKLPYSLEEFGNTSSATIPVTMVHRLGEQLHQEKTRLLLSGFGVGLSWASASLECSPMITLPMIEC